MGKSGRHQEENHMALRPAQFRSQRPYQRSEYKNGVEPPRTHLHKDDWAIPPCRRQPETGCDQLPRWNQLCADVKEKPPNPKPISPMWFVGFFLFAANHNENKKGKSECEIGNGDYDFGVRPTNILQGFWAAKSVSCSSKHNLQNPDGFRCDTTESEGLIAPKYNRLHTEKTAIIGRADCFNYSYINTDKIHLHAMRKNKIWRNIVDISLRSI